MKKICLLNTIFFCSLSGLFSQIPAWEQRADYPGDGRSAAVTFSFPDKGFIGTGYDGEDFRRSFYMYDPATDFWLQTESIGGPGGDGMERNCASSFSIGDKGYVATGQSGDPFLQDLWEYNRISNTWTLKANVGGIDRRCGIGFGIDDMGYVGLGQDATGFRRDLWAYDSTTNTWSQKADFIGTPRRFAACFVIDGRAYVGTGDDGAFKQDFYRYDPATNAWSLRAPFAGSPRYGATGFAVNGIGYFTCGYDTTLTNRSDFYQYDPLTDIWTQLDDFPGGPRSYASAFVVDTLAFVGMGYDTSYLFDLWMWGDTTNPKPIDTAEAILGQYMQPQRLHVYPNPANAYMRIDIPEIFSQMPEISVYNFNGQSVSSQCSYSGEMNGYESYINLNIQALPPGSYQVMLTSDTSRYTATIVVL